MRPELGAAEESTAARERLTSCQLVDTKGVSELTGIPEATLRFWRHKGDVGPRSFSLGPRKVVYKRTDVEAWIEAQYAKAVGE